MYPHRFGYFMKELCNSRSECWAVRGVENITLGVREGAATSLRGNDLCPALHFPLFCSASYFPQDLCSILHFAPNRDDCGETFSSPIYIGTDSFGINYKLHKPGFEFGFSG